MPETYENLRRTDEGRVATLSLARPEARNALDAAVENVVSQLLQGGPEAQAAIKTLLHQVEATEPLEALGLMTGLIAELRTSAEGQEGLGAFLEKREPRWRNS